MKKIILFAIPVLLLLCFFTNPSAARHQEAVAEDLKQRLYTTPEGKDLLKTIPLTRILAFNQESVQTKVSSKDYYLFSLTRITYPELSPPHTRFVGIGILGKVLLYSGM